MRGPTRDQNNKRGGDCNNAIDLEIERNISANGNAAKYTTRTLNRGIGKKKERIKHGSESTCGFFGNRCCRALERVLCIVGTGSKINFWHRAFVPSSFSSSVSTSLRRVSSILLYFLPRFFLFYFYRRYYCYFSIRKCRVTRRASRLYRNSIREKKRNERESMYVLVRLSVRVSVCPCVRARVKGKRRDRGERTRGCARERVMADSRLSRTPSVSYREGRRERSSDARDSEVVLDLERSRTTDEERKKEGMQSEEHSKVALFGVSTGEQYQRAQGLDEGRRENG